MADKEWIKTINEIKKAILRKKIILSIIIDSYSKYDKIYRYVHLFLALTAPIIAFINQLVSGSAEQVKTTTLIISSIVAGMIKIKDYLKFDKTKENAKQQTIKYGQLFQRIDREIRKPDDKRQNTEDFIYWINREFTNLEISDPELPNSLKDAYVALCKEKNIPYDEDIAILTNLIQSEVVNVVVDVVDKSEVVDKAGDKSEVVDKAGDKDKAEVVDKAEVIDKPEDKTTDLIDDKKDRLEYKKKVNTLDTSKDLQWAIDRLSSLE